MIIIRLLSHNDNTVSFMHIVQRASFLNYAFEVQCWHVVACNASTRHPHPMALQRFVWQILANNELIGQTYNLSPTLPNHKVMPPFPATGEVCDTHPRLCLCTPSN